MVHTWSCRRISNNVLGGVRKIMVGPLGGVGAAWLTSTFAMMKTMDHPGVGVGVYVRKDGKVLMGKRLSAFGRETWCAPGGKLDMFEDIFDCARRETMEEAGIEIDNLNIVGITSDISKEHEAHFITFAVAADWKSGEARLMEPDKFNEWRWFAWDNLPEPLFLSTQNFVDSGRNPFTAQSL